MSKITETIKQERHAFALCLLLFMLGAYLAFFTFDKAYIADKYSYECRR